ncbi:MarR family winged helix-turn-helix transcriptional regulator [Arthrobacter sp. ISL-28]|uniref:MarR family winged helix-turn-helix transcriptional regulator n=1 Tax=Arthrobacter sp. ISL-28 TaxID=2819108 RepID=UPI001BED1264|nr:MarR family transcriptional regulator [Arthrobacter sp. ISL-28]MBT2523854.1 MarR family transcriptional regulator [Arthrobacter sp. ISL-28]
MMKPTQEPLGITLAAAARETGRAFDAALQSAGGSRPVWLVLMALKQHATANQREIAQKVGIQGATLTHHLDAMESSGLLTRRRDPHNRRVHIVELTEAGHALFFQLLGTVTAFDKRLRDGLDESDIATLRRLLAILRHNVGSSAESAKEPARND